MNLATLVNLVNLATLVNSCGLFPDGTMEYAEIIHIQNTTPCITYIPNITPEPEHLLSFASVEPFAYLEHFMFLYFASFAYLEHSLFLYFVSVKKLSLLSFISVKNYLLLSLVSLEELSLLSLTYLEPLLPFLHLLPLAFLALLTLITLLITYNKTQYIEDDLSEDDLSEDDLSEDDLSEDEDYTSSTIEKCIIVNREGGIVSDNNKFRGILVDIWKTMEKQDILDNTTFKFKSGNKRGLKGYKWFEPINMSFQNKDSNKTLKEILNMVKVNNVAIDLSITLKTGEVIHFID